MATIEMQHLVGWLNYEIEGIKLRDMSIQDIAWKLIEYDKQFNKQDTK